MSTKAVTQSNILVSENAKDTSPLFGQYKYRVRVIAQETAGDEINYVHLMTNSITLANLVARNLPGKKFQNSKEVGEFDGADEEEMGEDEREPIPEISERNHVGRPRTKQPA